MQQGWDLTSNLTLLHFLWWTLGELEKHFIPEFPSNLWFLHIYVDVCPHWGFEALLRCENWTHLADQQTRSPQWYRLGLIKRFWHQIKAETNGFPGTGWQHQSVKCQLEASVNQRISGSCWPPRRKMSLYVKSWSGWMFKEIFSKSHSQKSQTWAMVPRLRWAGMLNPTASESADISATCWIAAADGEKKVDNRLIWSQKRHQQPLHHKHQWSCWCFGFSSLNIF